MMKYLRYFKSSNKLKELVERATDLLKKGGIKEKLKDSKSQLDVFLSMLKSHYKGEFKIKKRYFLYIVMAVVYFVNPLDMIPDFLMIGLLDDLTVVGWVYSQVDTEIQRYQDFLDKKCSTTKGEQSKESDQKVKNSDS